MLEESIEASPNRCNRSLKQKLEHRKSKRHRLSELSAIDVSAQAFPNVADAYKAFDKFWDSDSEENSELCLNRSNLSNKNGFERFKEENKLAAADRVLPCTPRRKPQEPTQMFQTCDYLLKTQNVLEFSSNADTQYLSCGNEVVEDVEDFDIQTEWLREPFDLNAEADRSLDETLKPATPQLECNNNKSIDTTFLEISQPTSPKKSIVEQILEDFCADLSDEEDDREYEPYFRFRKRPIRTYERRFRCAGLERKEKPTTNLANENEPPFDMNKNDFSDTSSELSVQEAPTQSIPAIEPLVLNTSGAVHNNLMNLSAFFTQNLLEQPADCVSVPDDLEAAPEEVSSGESSSKTNEILTLRLKYEHFSKPILDLNTNDLLGFASPAEYAARTTQMNSNVKRVNIETGEYEKPAQANSQGKSMEIQVAADTNAFEEDTWQYDDEYFLDFKTQMLLKNAETPSEAHKDEATNNKLTLQKHVSACETQIAADELLKLFEKPFKSPQHNEEEHNFDFNDMILSEWPLEMFDCEPKLKNEEHELDSKQLVPVKQEQLDEDILAKLFEKEEFTEEMSKVVKEQPIRTTTTALLDQPTTSKQAAALVAKQQLVQENFSLSNTNGDAAQKPFMGFRTGNAKEIHVSEQARKKAAQIFAELPDLPKQPPTTKTASNSPVKVAENSASKPAFFGFQTASAKPIVVSDTARKKYQNFFDEVLKDDEAVIEKSTDETIEKQNAPKSTFCGFQTASNKPIVVTEKARKQYANFFNEDDEGLSDKAVGNDISTRQPHQMQEKPANENLNKRKFCSLYNASERNDDQQPTKQHCKANTTLSPAETTTPVVRTSSQSRRYALSLTRKRRSSLCLNPNNIAVEANKVETPVKPLNTAALKSSAHQAAQTPNAAEFYKSLPNASSTPQTGTAYSTTPNRSALRSADNLDADFKRINWDRTTDDGATNNDIMPLTPKRDENSKLDVTLKHLPSPQERIENLSGCGDPPPLPRINLRANSTRQRRLGLSRCYKSFQQS